LFLLYVNRSSVFGFPFSVFGLLFIRLWMVPLSAAKAKWKYLVSRSLTTERGLVKGRYLILMRVIFITKGNL